MEWWIAIGPFCVHVGHPPMRKRAWWGWRHGGAIFLGRWSLGCWSPLSLRRWLYIRVSAHSAITQEKR